MMKLLITGGMGFIGSNFILYMLERYSSVRLTNIDLLSYAGNPDNLAAVERHPRYRFVYGDVSDSTLIDSLLADGFDAVVHFAAESHVDRSIAGPYRFVHTNVMGTYQLLESARKHNVGKFIQVSTDEVYGSLGKTGSFSETTPLAPNSPYSASKAGADLLSRSYWRTYGLPVVITRCSNNYGPRQFPEKLLPLMIANALQDRKIALYGDGMNIRDWLYVADHCRAIDLVLRHGQAGEIYNIGGGHELTNLELARRVLAELGKPESLIEFVEDRPGHDFRYAIDSSKIRRELGWTPDYDLAAGLRFTLEWYATHPDWLRRIETGEYTADQERLKQRGGAS